MVNVLKHFANTILYLFTAVLVIIAISISAVRYYPNISDIVEQKIEVRLGSILNSDIVIESLDIYRREMPPKIIAQNVTITNRSDPTQSWSIKKVLLGIDVIGSIFSRTLRVREVGLEGMDIAIHRDRAGDVHINQVFLLPGNAMQSTGSESYSKTHLRLLDAKVRWRDEISDIDYMFEHIDIAIDPTKRGYRVYLAGNLPEQLGKSVKAYFHIDGDVKEIQKSNIKFYLQTDQLRLAEIAKRFVGASGEKVPVVIQTEAWGEIQDATLVSLRGSLDANNIGVAADRTGSKLCLSEDYVRQVSMQFSWQYEQDNWRFDANKIRVITAQHDWPQTEMHFKTIEHSLNAKSVYAHIGRMDIGAICNTLRSYSPHIVRFDNHLEQYRFNARIENLLIRFDLGDEHRTSFQYAANVNNASLWLADGNRSISGVSGHIIGGDAGGRVTLNSEDVSIVLPTLYPEQTLTFGSRGDVQWQHQGDHYKVRTENLNLFNQELTLNARVLADVVGKQIYIDAQANIPSAKASAIGAYFPVHVRTVRTKKWLSEAIQGGEVTDATVLWRGDVRKFPYHNSAGVFEVAVNVADGTLEYKRDWPKLTEVEAKVSINKQRIEVTSQHARMFDSKIKNVDIYIESFLRAVLNAHGVADGPGLDLLRFLNESSLLKKENSIVEKISLAGDTRLVLDFSRSISRKVDHPFQIKGDLHFLGNTLDIHTVGLQLQDLGGEISFDAEGASGEDISAVLMGNPIQLSASPAGNGATEISFSGPFDVGTYIAQRYPKYSSLVSGAAEANGVFRLPSLFDREQREKVKLYVNSDLVGVSSNLPVPMQKDAETVLHSSLNFDDADKFMHWQFKDLLSLYFKKDQNQPFVLRDISLGDYTELELDSKGLKVSGSVDQLALNEWLAVYQQYLKSEDNDDVSTSWPEVNLSIEDLQWPTWPAQQLTVKGMTQEEDYVVNVQSTLGSGSVKIPKQSGAPVVLDLQNLILVKNESESELEFDPRLLRPIEFSTQQLGINKLNFKNVSVRSTKIEQGLSFDKIYFEAQDMHVNGSGSWQVANEGQQQSTFNLELVSIDVEDSLEDLGFSSALRKGELDSRININWLGAPYQYSLENMFGTATMNMRDGVVKEVEPGAGRLLALLNLGAISRRLSLDFTDVTKEGFTFDSIKGELELFKGGKLYADKVDIKASAADILISGSTNIVQRNYDQTIYVTPKVSGTLPAAGAIVGGPVGAAAGIVAERIASVVGLNKVTQTQYKMTGTWEAPQITRVKKKPEKQISAAPPQNGGQQSPVASDESSE